MPNRLEMPGIFLGKAFKGEKLVRFSVVQVFTKERFQDFLREFSMHDFRFQEFSRKIKRFQDILRF